MTTLDKRLVAEYTQGPMKGIFQIFGIEPAGKQPPSHFPGPFQIGHVDAQQIEFLSLIRVTPRAAYYREVFDRTQVMGRLDDFMPEGPAPSFNPQQV